jgi:hypothetical protein
MGSLDPNMLVVSSGGVRLTAIERLADGHQGYKKDYLGNLFPSPSILDTPDMFVNG